MGSITTRLVMASLGGTRCCAWVHPLSWLMASKVMGSSRVGKGSSSLVDEGVRGRIAASAFI